MGASTVQLSTALSNVRSFLNEPSAQEWSDLQLTAYLNMGQADVQRKAEALRSTLIIPVVANTDRKSVV